MDKCKEIYELLKAERIYADVYFEIGEEVVAVEIHWGDWKHEHARTRWLLTEAGYTHITSRVTEENGSDTYSAIHYFM